jgi:hypothetical protein
MHNVPRPLIIRTQNRTWRKEKHGEESTEKGKEARSHQAVVSRSLRVQSGCKFFVNETTRTQQTRRKEKHGKESSEEGQKAPSHQAVDRFPHGPRRRRSLRETSGCKSFVNETGRASALPVFFASTCHEVAGKCRGRPGRRLVEPGEEATKWPEQSPTNRRGGRSLSPRT